MVIINLGSKYRNEYLSLTGLGVKLLRFTGMDFAGIRFTGMDFAGIRFTGMDFVEMSITGFMFDILTVICRYQSHVCTFYIYAGIGRFAYFFNNVHNLFLEIICIFTLC